MSWVLPPLLKSAVAFAEAQHPRAADGRFADGNGGGGSPQTRPISAPGSPQRRTLERMSSWHNRANRVPHGYTGKHDVELPVGSFTKAELALHKPKEMTRDQHQALLGNLTQVIHGEREGTIAAGQEPKKGGKLKGRILIPEGTERRTMRRAYNHAAMIALHEFGVGKYDFAMDDTLKSELRPLVPFIHYAKRRMLNTMLDREKGGWRPYRRAFGETFADRRNDKTTGEVRLRKPLVGQVIKAVPMGGLFKAVRLGAFAFVPRGTVLHRGL